MPQAWLFFMGTRRGLTYPRGEAFRVARVEPRHRGSDAALDQKNQPLRRDRAYPRGELFAPLAVGLGITRGGVERLFSAAEPASRIQIEWTTY
jgi:hypothetical protein